MKTILKIFLIGFIGSTFLFSCNENKRQNEDEEAMANSPGAEYDMNSQDREMQEKVNVESWSETAKKAANAMMKKYGDPSGHTADMLVWENTGPFKRTIVYKEEIQHDFPMPHKDVLEQFIDYDAPLDKYDELAEFDGSVIVERTKGEMSARCDKEAANLLALNLAHDVATGKKSVNEAREFYATAIMEMLQGNKKEYLTSLQIDTNMANASDPDETTMNMDKVKELKSKMKESDMEEKEMEN